MRHMAGSNEITRKLWEIVQYEDGTATKEKTYALSQLMQSYENRLQTLTASPESYLNIKKSLTEIDLQRLVDSEPMLKAQVQQRNSLSDSSSRKLPLAAKINICKPSRSYIDNLS